MLQRVIVLVLLSLSATSCISKPQRPDTISKSSRQQVVLSEQTFKFRISCEVSVPPGQWNTLLDEYCKSQYPSPIWQECFIDKAVPDDVITAETPSEIVKVVSDAVAKALHTERDLPSGDQFLPFLKEYCKKSNATLMKYRMVTLGTYQVEGDILCLLELRFEEGSGSPFPRVTHLMRISWR